MALARSRRAGWPAAVVRLDSCVIDSDLSLAVQALWLMEGCRESMSAAFSLFKLTAASSNIQLLGWRVSARAASTAYRDNPRIGMEVHGYATMADYAPPI